MNVYIVKSGIANDSNIQWSNLKAFKNMAEAMVFAKAVEKQIDIADLDETEFVYVEEFTLE